MNEMSVLGKFARGFLFVFGAGLIIYLQRMPNSFLNDGYYFQNGLFSWTAAFINRRPNSANLISVFLVSAYYALQMDEGMALGGMMLLALSMIITRIRLFNINNTFMFEWLVVSAIYMLLLIFQQLLLLIFLSPHYHISEIAWLIMTFFISYPILNLIIVALVGSRKGTAEL